MSAPAVAPKAAQIHVLISRQEIAEAVERLAAEIRRDYQGTKPLLVGVLRGAFVFLADLMRALDMPVTVDFVRIASYGAGTKSSGRPRFVYRLHAPVKGCHVLVVEDIVDTGLTTAFLWDYLRRRGAASVKLCALLSKPARRQVEVPIDYLGFTVPDRFIVGYGLDYAQEYRWLPDICVLEESREAKPRSLPLNKVKGQRFQGVRDVAATHRRGPGRRPG